jgi:hypothetical protein
MKDSTEKRRRVPSASEAEGGRLGKQAPQSPNEAQPVPLAQTRGEAIDSLSSLAAELNAKTDELNSVFEDFEAQLAKTRIGVSVWLDDSWADVETEEDEQVWLGWRIGYAKIGDQWRLAAQRMRVRFHQDGIDRYARAPGGSRPGPPAGRMSGAVPGAARRRKPEPPKGRGGAAGRVVTAAQG